MIEKYPVQTHEKLRSFLNQYMPTVLRAGEKMGFDLKREDFTPDHLGLQVLNKAEFDAAHKVLSQYATLVHDEVIHERRNRAYRFIAPMQIERISIPGIEIFEPKPNADATLLRPGIEHVAFVTKDPHRVHAQLGDRGLIAKVASYSLGKFIKTKLVDGVEIEFREKALIGKDT